MKEQVKASGNNECEIWEENWPSFAMFFRISTQWVVTQGGFVGLNYNAVFDAFRLYRVKDRQKVFEDIQIIERAALRELNKEA